MRLHLLFLSLLAAAGVHAQLGGKSSIGGYAGLAVPTGEFERTWGRNSAVVGGHMGFAMGVLPLQAGFAFSYSRMGQYTSTVPVQEDFLAVTEGQLKVNAKVLSYHPLLRLNPLRGKVRPYVDGMVGFRHFTTISTISIEGMEDPLERERRASDLAFSTGWAAGVMVRLGGVGYFEARVESFNSGKATYVDPTSITANDNGGIGFSTLNSNTDAVHVMLGLGLSF